MAFTIRNFDTITLEMIQHARATQKVISDWNIGAVGRTIIEAPAIALDEFYQLMLSGILEAIPVSVYQAFQFDVVPPVFARGIITISFAGPIVEPFTIPADTVFSSSTQNYLSESDTVVGQGVSSVSLYAVCSNYGVQGNAPTGSITSIQNFTLPAGASVSNTAISSGNNGETDAERINRFANYVLSLVRGTPYAVTYAAKSAVILNNSSQVIEYVQRAHLSEEPGHVYIYIWGNTGHPSSELIAASQLVVDGSTGVGGYRPAGMRCEVLSMTELPVDVTIVVKAFLGNTTHENMSLSIENVLTKLIDSIESGGTLYAADIKTTILSVAGVYEVHLDTNSNIICPDSDVLVMGTLQASYQ